MAQVDVYIIYICCFLFADCFGFVLFLFLFFDFLAKFGSCRALKQIPAQSPS